MIEFHGSNTEPMHGPSQAEYGIYGPYAANQGSWNTGTQGSSSPHTGQTYSSDGYGTGNMITYQEAEQQLSKYGYNALQDLKPMKGWSAEALKDGKRVRVYVTDAGLVATVPGD